ncbi:MFS transporter [Candidimonas sp. SYP-B2681]|uniref:MFS transporter n=1 Tax=Candidimonas sp. SYP-B2681 TaxID=2497686 RepID=UPI000F865833|nr:MFS transporter [Candidimonas sp. SYP-B2681]
MSTQALDSYAGDQTTLRQAGDQPAYWSGVFAMTLCAFALVASEFMPVSLLTPVAADLQISEGLAGQAISVSGAFAVLTSLFISTLAGKASRKALLLGMTGLMFLSAPIIALAPNYATYIAGRVLLGVAIGGFWSMSAASAMRLVPASKVPRALAIFNCGNALATVVAAPLGSYLGSIIGWRGAFLCLAPVALLAFSWQWISLPAMNAEERTASSGNVFKLLKNPQVALGMAAVSIFFMGQFALFTYLRPFLETVTGVDVSTLSSILLTIGLGGFIGTILISSFLKKNFYGTLVIIPLLMAAIAVALIAFGSSLSISAALLGLWGLVATAAPVGWWSWLARTLPENAEAGGGLMVAVVQLAIGLGSTFGGLLFDMSGYQSTFVTSAALLLISAFLAFLTSRAEHAQKSVKSL